MTASERVRTEASSKATQFTVYSTAFGDFSTVPANQEPLGSFPQSVKMTDEGLGFDQTASADPQGTTPQQLPQPPVGVRALQTERRSHKQLPRNVRIAAAIVGAVAFIATPVTSKFAYNVVYDRTVDNCSTNFVGCISLKGAVAFEDWLSSLVPGGKRR